MNEADGQINDLEYKEAKSNHAEQREEKIIQKNEDSVSILWDNFKRSNICLIGMSEEEEKGQEFGILSEKNSERKLPNLLKEIDMQVQGIPESQL